MDKLVSEDFYSGSAKLNDKAFSARDRINRAPKSLGFVRLKPGICLTDIGKSFVYGKHPDEALLRQLIKFQLPSPFHRQKEGAQCCFCVKPYLEIMRLIYELEFLTFDELKIFGLQLTNFSKYDYIKNHIEKFREQNKTKVNSYKVLSGEVFDYQIEHIYQEEIESGKMSTRESRDSSKKYFVKTKQSNLRDYADACFRYLHFTNLFAISSYNHKIYIPEDKICEVKYILDHTNREPEIFRTYDEYISYLGSSSYPEIYTDNKDNIIDSILRLSSFTKNQLKYKNLDDLKEFRDQVIKDNKNTIIANKVKTLKSFDEYSDVVDTFTGIKSGEFYDNPLMLEYNT